MSIEQAVFKPLFRNFCTQKVTIYSSYVSTTRHNTFCGHVKLYIAENQRCVKIHSIEKYYWLIHHVFYCENSKRTVQQQSHMKIKTLQKIMSPV